MPDRAKVVYEALILCEDIRLEFDGKRTLVGIYTGDIIGVPHLPFNIIFSVFATGLVLNEGIFRPSIIIADSDGNELYQDRASEDIFLNEGRFTQNLLIQWETTKPGTFITTLFDNDIPVASAVHAVGVGQEKSSDLRGVV